MNVWRFLKDRMDIYIYIKFDKYFFFIIKYNKVILFRV